MANLILHTRESQRPELDSLDGTPYERVLAVTQAGSTRWDRTLGPFAANNSSESIEAIEHSFEVPERFARRTATFIEQVLGYGDVNCHTFASYIADDGIAPTGLAAILRARRIMIDGVKTTELPAVGQQAVIGRTREIRSRRVRTAPLHSFVRLDRTRCLQVTKLRGCLALAHCDDLLEWYEVNRENGNKHLYVRQPTT